jgi:3-methyladenine DNA glycosylase AlkD
MTTAAEAKKALRKLENHYQAENLGWFFKTGPGEYGEGDKFLGLRVPQTRAISKQFIDLSQDQISILLDSEYHEDRQLGLFILILQFKRAKDLDEKQRIFTFYIEEARRGRVNNWDLVDGTAPYLGAYLVETNNLQPIWDLAKEENLWLKRISVLLTFAFLRAKDEAPTFEIAEYHLNHPHDLMHKAVGWMLREMGKINSKALTGFLEKHATEMPRTMLRYSIEKLEESERKAWLAKK